MSAIIRELRETRIPWLLIAIPALFALEYESETGSTALLVLYVTFATALCLPPPVVRQRRSGAAPAGP